MKAKGYGFVLTQTAENDIDLAFSYISETLGNPDAVSDLADELEEQIDKICNYPKTGRLVENDFLRRSDVRRALVKSYIIYYLIDDRNNNIVILRFVYSGRNQDEIINDL